MKRRALLLATLALAPLLAVPMVGSAPPPALPRAPVVLVMQGVGFNGLSYPYTPLIEAYVGETLSFTLLVPHAGAEEHTFHLHGNPWPDSVRGRTVDATLVKPGGTDRFDVLAGGPDAQAGDWMYHCHIADHHLLGMWGIFRVYNFAIEAQAAPGDASTLLVRLHRLGVPVEGATLELTQGDAPLAAHVEELQDGHYRVHGAPTGPLVLTARHADLGHSVARLNGAPAPTLATGGAPLGGLHAHG